MDSDDDDIYDTGNTGPSDGQHEHIGSNGEVKMDNADDGEEEGEEVEEEDSDDVRSRSLSKIQS